jgi:predicted GTPase
MKKGETIKVINGKTGAGKSSTNIDDLFGDYCSVCGTELLEVVDEDPNGQMKATCARCEKMEEIDFDLFPDATVNRGGLVDYGDGEE